MTEVIFYSSPNIRVFSHGAWNSRFDVFVVCFQYMQPNSHLDLPGFAEEFFRKQGIDAAYVNCATNEWFQYPDLPVALSVLRSLGSRWRRVITYGSSMGAYAALRFASAIGAECSIAVGPQFSPRSMVIAGEHRYDAMVAQTKFLYEDEYQASSSVDNYVVYDPLLGVDTRHVLAYRDVARLLLVPIPCGGHTPIIPLAQCGILSDFVLQLIEGTFSASRFREEFRQKRRLSSEYWRQLARHLIDHSRPEIAQRVAELSPKG